MNIRKRILILGSTGSIGTNTLDVIAHLKAQGHAIEACGLAAGANADVLIAQAQATGCKSLALVDKSQAEKVKTALPGITLFTGDNAASELTQAAIATGCTDVCAAIVGFAGLAPTLLAAQAGLRIHLANKESLVAGGQLMIDTCRQTGASLLPVDSEHAAIQQCIGSRLGPLHVGWKDPTTTQATIDGLYLTASGGAFRDTQLDEMARATASQALQHPTWNMGAKVTLDSATMVNKALEIIEAHWLFGLPANQLHAIIHPQSTVHGMVQFKDGALIAQLSPTDMRHPIQSALTWPDPCQSNHKTLNPFDLHKIEFCPIDVTRYPLYALGHAAIQAGGTAGALLNAINEEVGDAFLQDAFPFGKIAPLIQDLFGKHLATTHRADSLDAVQATDSFARAMAREALKRMV